MCPFLRPTLRASTCITYTSPHLPSEASPRGRRRGTGPAAAAGPRERAARWCLWQRQSRRSDIFAFAGGWETSSPRARALPTASPSAPGRGVERIRRRLRRLWQG
eukprot:scaffold127096_cov30-Phaeocystis_antarctica.AAC.1